MFNGEWTSGTTTFPYSYFFGTAHLFLPSMIGRKGAKWAIGFAVLIGKTAIHQIPFTSKPPQSGIKGTRPCKDEKIVQFLSKIHWTRNICSKICLNKVSKVAWGYFVGVWSKNSVCLGLNKLAIYRFLSDQKKRLLYSYPGIFCRLFGKCHMFSVNGFLVAQSSQN